MKLSILILTHNRPQLFERCIKSVLRYKPDYNVEIIVNNDSCDITEIYDETVEITYFYEKHKKLTDTYKFLYNRSQGEYIFYLEDDDYIQSNFFNCLNFNYDINFLNYISKDIITNSKDKNTYYRRFFQKNKNVNKITDLSVFLEKYEYTDFQLSQIVFRRTGLKYWPTNDNINNDYKIFKSLNLESILYISKPCWVQTTDGKDNISFDAFNTDIRFK